MTLQEEIDILKQLPIGAEVWPKTNPNVKLIIIDNDGERFMRVKSSSELHTGWFTYGSLSCEAIRVLSQLKQ